MHVGVLPVCLHHMHAKGSLRTEEGVSSQSGVRVGFEPDPPCWCWKSSVRGQVLFAADPNLGPLCSW